MDGTLVPCDRRVAGLLAYLAVEGPTARHQIAQLFWPDVPASQAGNNLVHALRRLEKQSGAVLIVRQPQLRLAGNISVDLKDLLDGTLSALTGSTGQLEGLELDDAPDFMEWLMAIQERVSIVREQGIRHAIDDAVTRGDVTGALMLARRLLDLDPLSEHGYRALMRLHALDGDRATALKAYRRYKALLDRELGVAPHPDLVQFARDIDAGRLPRAPEHPRIPMAVLRPPHLVGREEAWQMMEDAWVAGKTIYLSGAPGAGKTRLAQDFARSKGAVLYLQGRPGEQDVPFSGAARNARARLAAAPHVRLPAWVKRELARILPEFRQGEAPLPLLDEEERLTFFQAHLEMIRLTSPGFTATITDDIQYYDPATMDLGVFFLSQSATLGGQGNVPHHLIVFRRDEFPPESQRTMERHVSSGSAVRIDVEPLSQPAITQLLATLAIPEALQISGIITHSTGGNVQFVLEAVKHMYETGNFSTEGQTQPMPDTIGTILHQRLQRLSPAAVQVVRAAAVLRTDISIERVAELLNTPLFATAAAWEELELAQVLTGERFSHDLIQENILNTTPAPVRQILHRAAARVLTDHGAAPAVIAGHWRAAGAALQAAAWLHRAAHAAEATLRFQEAADLYRAAAHALTDAGEASQAHAALELAARADIAHAQLPAR
ncbi:AAA ATPase domain-containing protein [Deinococcus hopiensis KR-140]|uniref:AAA ATPase domain-containing protein n=2 Tax=Deinococcus TaxID=1298 RepID=A0A1W1UYK1_9DEIO|nr:AAA ATPase domain-containing protein [Deinococcus hopiensis KR-140]